MILYNVTIILEEEIHEAWLNWLKQEYLVQVMGTGYFISYRVLKVLDSPNEGLTYCIQYIADSNEKYREYLSCYGNNQMNHVPDQFLNKFVVFTTLMEYIETE